MSEQDAKLLQRLRQYGLNELAESFEQLLEWEKTLPQVN